MRWKGAKLPKLLCVICFACSVKEKWSDFSGRGGKGVIFFSFGEESAEFFALR